MEIIPRQINDMGQREYEVLICKCDMLELLTDYAAFQLVSEHSCSLEGTSEVHWTLGSEKFPDADHFVMARVKLHAIPVDAGPLN